MPLPVDPGLAALFGSADRARILAALANAESPPTAYRVAAMVGMKPPNVYRELRRLLRFNEVGRTTTREGRTVWSVIDPSVRTLLRRRLRVVWSEDILEGADRRSRRARRILVANRRDPVDLSAFGPGRAPSAIEVRRREAKDRVLTLVGARSSRRSG